MTSDFPFLPILDVEFTRRSVDELEEALKKKDQDLAEAQKEASSKTKLAEEKLASVGTLEQDEQLLGESTEISLQIVYLPRQLTRLVVQNHLVVLRSELLNRRTPD